MNTGLTVWGCRYWCGFNVFTGPAEREQAGRLIVDKMVRASNVTAEGIDTIWRDWKNRSQGILASVRSSRSHPEHGSEALQDQ